MSFADGLLEPLQQTPVLGTGGVKGRSHMIGTLPERNIKGWKWENTLSFHLGGWKRKRRNNSLKIPNILPKTSG